MSSGRRICATAFAAAALLVCHLCASFIPAWANDDEDPHAILFSGSDLWLNGAFAHGGFLFAPSGLYQDGLLLKILFSGGLYRYDAKSLGGERVIGAENSRMLSLDGASNAAMRNSNSSSDPNSKSIIASRTIHQIGFAEIRSVCGWHLNFGTSRH
jgi:hypothetical protein